LTLNFIYAKPGQLHFERIFAVLEKGAWEKIFLEWTMTLSLSELPPGEREILAIDGKTVCGSRRAGQHPLHMVSVWSAQHQLVLGSMEVPEKTNEITVIPKLLEIISPAGAIITADAMGCQKQVAWAAREHHADYLLALKDNHKELATAVRNIFQHQDHVGWEEVDHSFASTANKGHGRHETRQCWMLYDLGELYPEQRSPWRDLRSVVRVRSSRTIQGKITVQERFYLSSLYSNADEALRASRLHWSIENSLHWSLDVTFDEDRSTAHLKNASANWVALRQLALVLLKKDSSYKASLRNKRFRAALDLNFLAHLLTLR
jgi:predicted transposase YbfD/YdcC